MNALNEFKFTGRLSSDVETSKRANGDSIAKFSIAVDNPFKKDADGNYCTDFFLVVTYGSTADYASKNLGKGDLVTCCGSVHNNNYTKEDGTKVYGFRFDAEAVQRLVKKQ